MNGGSFHLLDTNTATYVLNGRSIAVRTRYEELLPAGRLAVSAITEAELLYGLERKPGATRLRAAVHAFLSSVSVIPWDSEAALAYARLRAHLESQGKALSALDMLIAAHAMAVRATLVTHDKAFTHAAPTLTVTDWATDL